jgi:hypothetical protein
MKKYLVAILVAIATPSYSQTVAPAAPSLDIYPIGKNFGSNGTYQIGFDKSQTVGACAGYDIPDHIFLTGPCRDFVILAHNGKSVAHMGGFLGYGLKDLSKSHPYWSARAGVSIGAAASSALNRLADDVPAFDALGAYQAPAWAAYVGKISDVEYFVGDDFAGHLAHGPMANFTIPLADIAALIGSFGD